MAWCWVKGEGVAYQSDAYYFGKVAEVACCPVYVCLFVGVGEGVLIVGVEEEEKRV